MGLGRENNWSPACGATGSFLEEFHLRICLMREKGPLGQFGIDMEKSVPGIEDQLHEHICEGPITETPVVL